MLLENADYFVRLVPFPPGKIDGCVTPNDDGTFSIYIDANAPREKQIKALNHEVEHLERDDFYTEAPIECIEPVVLKPRMKTPEERSEEYFSSWQRAIAWAEQMRAAFGDSDQVPAYSA